MITRRGVDASFPLEEREEFLRDLREGPFASVVLSTCDRVEVYEGSGSPDPSVVRHLFRVVSGLESPLLGEHQIQAQVKQAYQAALMRPLNPGLHRLFQQALRVGKRVRTETRLGQGALGHAQIVVNLLCRLPIPLDQLGIVVLGVNHLNRGIVKFLVDRGHRTWFLSNRTLDKAQALVADLGAGLALPLDDLPEVLKNADVVISATSAPHLILHAHQVPDDGRPRYYFDLAVPRDLDPALALRSGASLYNVTDLEREARVALSAREDEVSRAQAILEDEVTRYFEREAVT